MARQPTFAVHISLTVSLKNVYSDLAERLLHDEKPRFLKLFPLSGNPVASYGESQDSCAMTAVAERSSCQSGDSQSSSPWDTSHKPYGYSTGCEAEPASPHDDPRQAWSVIYANDT